MIEPIELSYDLHLLPPGGVAFRRWRWELWHGPRLLAAGWRLSVLHAQRALRVHAMRYAHRLHGVHPLRPDDAKAPESAWGRRPVAVQSGELRVVLTPRPLLESAA
ncbi:MAG: hypothetical protein WBQ18_02030 [Solirubrobacteraceae bacterium]